MFATVPGANTLTHFFIELIFAALTQETLKGEASWSETKFVNYYGLDCCAAPCILGSQYGKKKIITP
jgi:hypothetical protein